MRVFKSIYAMKKVQRYEKHIKRYNDMHVLYLYLCADVGECQVIAVEDIRFSQRCFFGRSSHTMQRAATRFRQYFYQRCCYGYERRFCH